MGERLVVREDVIETDPEIEGHCDELPDTDPHELDVKERVATLELDEVTLLETENVAT